MIRGSLTRGQRVAAELSLTRVVSPVAKLGKHLEAFYDLMAATSKVGMLLDLPVERTAGDRASLFGWPAISWLVAALVVIPVGFLAVSVLDRGDTLLDTAILLDNFQWECASCTPGSVDEAGSCGVALESTW